LRGRGFAEGRSFSKKCAGGHIPIRENGLIQELPGAQASFCSGTREGSPPRGKIRRGRGTREIGLGSMSSSEEGRRPKREGEGFEATAGGGRVPLEGPLKSEIAYSPKGRDEESGSYKKC